MTVELIHGDCIAEMAAMKAAGRTFASIVTDPPYGWAFMNKAWDHPESIAFKPDTWRLALDLLPPGGILAAFGGARTQHRIACAIEDAGFTIFDVALWLHAQGFPKARTQLKPAYEPIILARKPGPPRALAIDACRIPSEGGRHRDGEASQNRRYAERGASDFAAMPGPRGGDPAGRWPANVLHSGDPEVLEAFAAFGTSKSKTAHRGRGFSSEGSNDGWKFAAHEKYESTVRGHTDEGTAARFFYTAKASKAERQGSTHPCIKPLSLMKYLVKLITPPGGTVLDCFAGSGTTLLAAQLEGFSAVGIEQDPTYVADARKRLGLTFNLEAAD